jgi:glycosyltransferase involved in cell wall biosynthesis
MLKKGNYVLVLPSWYPSNESPYNGDFVKRHVAATANFETQHVVHVVKTNKAENLKATELFTNEVAVNFFEEILYYRSKVTGIPFFDQVLSHLRYLKLYKKALVTHFTKYGLPKIVHVHVAFKAGLLALWVLRKYKVPYVLTEHSCLYLPQANFNFSNAGKFFNWVTKKVVRHANTITTVSNYLAQHIKVFSSKNKFTIVPNVVDTTIFTLTNTAQRKMNEFVHISNFTEQKNFYGIVVAAAELKATSNFKIHCYGAVSSYYETLVTDLGLQNHIIFYGEQPQTVLAKALADAAALILFSHFETFGCVLIEANACGTPVIVSNLEVFNEFLQENVNAVFVPQNDTTALANTMASFCEGITTFNSATIAQTTNAYTPNKIGQQFSQVYKTVLQKNKSTNL